MSRNEIYSTGQIIPPSFIHQPCTIEAILVERVWGRRMNLICIFECEDGSRFSTAAWRRSASNSAKEIYAPRETEIDFANVDNGSRWRCSFKLSPRKTHTVWLLAEPI